MFTCFKKQKITNLYYKEGDFSFIKDYEFKSFQIFKIINLMKKVI